MMEIYGRKISVVYDVAAITNIIEGEDESKVCFAANLLYFSLSTIYTLKDGAAPSKDQQITFDEYWKLATSHLTLEKLNSLLQPNRLKPLVSEPLLKCLLVILVSSASTGGLSEEASSELC